MKIQINARNQAYQFEAEDGDRVLYGALRNAIEVPYECATGTCGTCKAKLIVGAIDDHWPEAPGRRYLKQEQGEFLMCQCSARTDITIEVANFVYTMDPGACMPAPYAGTISRTERLTHDVMAVDVELNRPCEFDAGQFMALGVPGITGLRAYSMVNFERNAERLQFVIKRKPGGGISEWLFTRSRVGTGVRLFGPLGHATFYPGIGKNLLCIAGGSGIAGMMSIISRGCQERYFAHYQGQVFFGVRTAQDAFYLDELSDFRQQFPETLGVTVALSEGEVPSSWRRDYPALRFDTGFVHEVTARHMKGRYENTCAYIAGPPPAVESAIRMLLLEARLTADNICYDKFS